MRTAVSESYLDSDREHDGYDELLKSIRENFTTAAKDGLPLYTTACVGLYDLFLENLPEEARQHYNCNACRHFVNFYGGIVQIDEFGKTMPVMWGKVPPFFSNSVESIKKRVSKAEVTGIFITGKESLGQSKTNGWSHMAVDMPRERIYRGKLKSAYEVMAEKLEEFKMLSAALEKYKLSTVETAVNLLRSDALFRSEKVLGMAEWLLDLHNSVWHKSTAKKANLIWRAVATAPAGFCHVSSSMIGTLLDDIADGYELGDVQRRFAEKMDPLKYQRPQAAPSVGNVVRAEKIVEKLGIANSLKRRYAKMEELELIWTPRPEKKVQTSGVFAGIQTKEKKEYRDFSLAPSSFMTWEKFRRTVLPNARKVEYLVGGYAQNFCAILTATDMSAPPIVQWDNEKQRNPFTWYLYSKGSLPRQWHLEPGYVEVTGITLQPSMWQKGFEHHGKGVLFILDGAKDSNCDYCSSCLFPEFLKSELREVRSTIEAYSGSNSPAGGHEATACGIKLTQGKDWHNAKFRVTTDIGTTIYTLDRWD